MADNKVTIEVRTDVEDSEVDALENQINKIKKQKIQLQLDAKTEQIEQAKARIDVLKKTIAGLEAVPPHLGIDIDDSEVQALKTELRNLERKTANLELDVEMGELQQAKSEIESLDGTEIDVNVNNISAMVALDQIGQGFDRLKQGASEVGQKMGEVLESSGRMEQTEAFLSMNLGADVAKKKLEEIRSVTDQLPGDDVTLQNLLSQATLKDANMTTDAFKQMGSAAADYMAAMQNFGKSSTETQQDLMNYILAGNTAEIERSPILQSHIDKLKEGTTVQERAKLLQEALNEEGWAGIASQDIYNNKLQSFNDMLERGKMNLGGMFQEGAKWGMDFLMQLDDATGGIVGMGIALGSFATPLVDTVSGLGQMATGMKAIKDLGLIKWLKELEIMTRLSAAADYILAGAQAVLNFIMSMNPIILVVMALIALVAILIWAYYNVDWFREMVDNAWASLVQFGQYIYSVITGAIQWLGDLFMQAATTISESVMWWWNAIVNFLTQLATFPGRVWSYLSQTIQHAISFASSFIQSMWNAGVNSVKNFISNISQIPAKLGAELSSALDKVNEWAATLPAKFWEAGVNAVKNFLSALGIASPGTMQRMLVWEVSEMGRRVPIEGEKLTSNLEQLGSDAVDSFGNPSLGIGFDDVDDNFANGSIDKMLNVAGQNRGDIVVNVYGDIDNDDRVRKLVDAVRRELNWNNVTAGRTI